MKKTIKVSLFIVMTFISIFLFAIILWEITFTAYYLADITFLGLLVFLPIKIFNKKYWIYRTSLFLLGVFILILTIQYPINEINSQIKYLAAKPREANRLNEFTFKDKLGIYGLNLMMGIFAYPIYPEVSKETLLMIFPSPKNGVRVFHSNFALNSPKIREVIRKFRFNLSKGKEKKKQMRTTIYWSAREYAWGNKEARCALALNPAHISLRAVKVDSNWTINVSIKVLIKYSKNAYLVILAKPELRIEEGLFWVLQKEGWIFPYTAEWKL